MSVYHTKFVNLVTRDKLRSAMFSKIDEVSVKDWWNEQFIKKMIWKISQGKITFDPN